MSKNILIIDDNYDSRQILSKILEGEGYNSFLASNEREALNILAKNKIDLILLDLKLGKENGFEVSKKLKHSDSYKNIPIVAISVSQLEEDIVNAINSGAIDFIGKPFNKRVLITRIRSILSIKEKEEQLIQLIEKTKHQQELLSQEAEFSKKLNQFLDMDAKRNFIRSIFPSFIGARLFTIFIIDDEKRSFKLFVSNHPNLEPNLIVPIEKNTIMYDALHKKKLIFLSHFSKSKYNSSRTSKYLTDIACSIPLISGDRTIGVLNVNDPEFRYLEEEDFKARIIRISQHLAVSIHNTLLFEKVKDLSMRDSMTGLYNFRHFLNALREEIEKAKKNKESLSCIMIDIDNFKQFNDNYGHQIGDLVLKELARSVYISIRSSDIPARYGGDEFIIILPRTNKELAIKLARRLMEVFNNIDIKIPDTEKKIKVTLSMGIASFPEDTTDMNELMKFADIALYKAKNSGKNRIVAYTEADKKTEMS